MEKLRLIPEERWDSLCWPVITKVSNKLFFEFNKDRRNLNNYLRFWKEALNPANFLRRGWNPYHNSRTMFIIHSFEQNHSNLPIIAVTTPVFEQLFEMPEAILNFSHHGLPVERICEETYPTCIDFWTQFYDKLSDEERSSCPVIDTGFRKNFIRENLLNKKVLEV